LQLEVAALYTLAGFGLRYSVDY